MRQTRSKPATLRMGGPARESLATGVKAVRTGLHLLQRDSARFAGWADLRLRAWQEALDPATAGWVQEARNTKPARPADEARADLERRIAEAREHS